MTGNANRARQRQQAKNDQGQRRGHRVLGPRARCEVSRTAGDQAGDLREVQDATHRNRGCGDQTDRRRAAANVVEVWDRERVSGNLVGCWTWDCWSFGIRIDNRLMISVSTSLSRLLAMDGYLTAVQQRS